MKQGWTGSLLSLLIVPVACVLAASALSLPVQPFTGVLLRSDQVVEVTPGGPGARAGVLPGDRIRVPTSDRRTDAAGPFAQARPGSPLLLERTRASATDRVWMVPEPLPSVERRTMAALLFMASGFVLIGSLTWSERRDRLARAFLLLCLAFAFLLAPLPRVLPAALAPIVPALSSACALFLPALFVHFMTLFPEPRGGRGLRARLVKFSYALSGALWLGSFIEYFPPGLDPAARGRAVVAVQGAAAIWFAGGFALALALFVAAYARAGSRDARRRLRVALLGTLLGAAPLAIATLVRNLAPSVPLPFDRWAVFATLLVPAAFAWAIAVHRVFDFRVALRGAAIALAVGALGAAAYLGAEWAGTAWPQAGGVRAGGLALAALALGAPLAGPVGVWLRGLAPRWTPAGLAEGAPDATDRGAAPPSLFEVACREIATGLRLDVCPAAEYADGAARAVVARGATRVPALEAGALNALGGASEPVPVDDARIRPQDRQALAESGVRWVLPVGGNPPRALLLLGRRLSGSWFGRLEARELARYSRHLAVELENAALRAEASSHGVLSRELAKAGAIQAHLLPRRAPVFPTLDAAAATLSSESVGGDYYDFIEHAPREFTLAVGDAAGKGVPAALVLAGVQARFRAEARRDLPPRALLTALNHELAGLDQPDRFMAMVCARVEVRAGRVWIANAGLPPPLVLRRSGAVETVTTGGVLLGVRSGGSYEEVCVELGAGDLLVLYTDGLSEARRGDELYGTQRLANALADAAGQRASGVLEALLADVRGWADDALDDLTVVILRQLTNPAGAPGTNGLKSRMSQADAFG